MKTIKVVAAVICDSIKEKKRIFATARGYGEFKGQWEFPGGKINQGEKPEDALVREFQEELQFSIQVEKKITTLKHGYTNFSVTLHAYLCKLIPENQSPILHFASDYRWIKSEDFRAYAFPAANRRLINLLIKL